MFFCARFASHWLYLQKRLCNFFVSFASHAIHGQRPMLFSKPRRFPKQKQKQRPRPSVWVSSFSPKKICFLVGFLGAQITHTGRFRETTRCGRFSLSKRLLLKKTQSPGTCRAGFSRVKFIPPNNIKGIQRVKNPGQISEIKT